MTSLLASLRLWAISKILPGLLRVPAALWSGLVNRVRTLDASASTNAEKQAAAESWLRGVLDWGGSQLPEGAVSRIVQCAVIFVRVEDLFGYSDKTPAPAPAP